jgi:5,10-methylenetetrahydromethanopterin reductase
VSDVSFGFMLFTNESVPTTVDQVRLGERLGYDSAWLLDSQLVGRELFVTMAAAAMATSKIRLGPGVTHAMTRHPTVLASGFASLAELAPGRIELALGFGDSAIRSLGGKPSRLEQFRADYQLIRQLLDGESATYHDQSVKLAWADPELTRQIPMYAVPGTGPKAQRLSGELGGGVAVLTDATRLGATFENLAEGARQAGKRPEDIDFIWWANTSISHDWDKVREHLAPRLASSIRHLYYDFRRGALTEEQLGLDVEVARRVAEEYRFLDHATAGAEHGKLLDAIPDAVWKQGQLVGTPDDVRRQLQQTLATYPQIRQVVLHMPVSTPRLRREDILETFASEVRPRLNDPSST